MPTPTLASMPAFIENAIDLELLRTADKIEFSIEKGEEMTTSYHPKGDDYFAGQHALDKYYHQGRNDRSAEWQDCYNFEIAPAMDRISDDSGRQWQEWTKREMSTTTPVSPLEETTITYQKEEGISLLNPDAPMKKGPNKQIIKHETYEEETSEQTFDMPDSGFFDKFKLTREKARSVSPPALRKSVNFGSVAEITTREQEFYPFRDAHQGKPLPGDNEFGTWGRGLNDPERQWKLSNGEWVRVGGKKQRDGDGEPDVNNWDKHLADILKSPPKKKQEEPEERPGSSSGSPLDSSRRSKAPLDFSNLDDDSDPDRRALRDKYRSKEPDSDVLEPAIKASEQPKQLLKSTGAEPDYKIDLGDLIKRYEPELEMKQEPEPEPKPQLVVEAPPKRIVLEPVQQVVVEPKQPVKRPIEEEEKRMDDPNLMWMKMGPAQYGPPFGSLRRGKAREEEWVGPPCELCHKQIEERRCMLAENMRFHFWHFSCSFCLKTLKIDDFIISEAEKKPYCLNCHKREFPEISLIETMTE